MADIHKIERIVLENFQQFPGTSIDLRSPSTNRPLEEVCLLGVNGTGKSSLLEQIHGAITFDGGTRIQEDAARILTAHRVDDELFFRLRTRAGDCWYCIPEADSKEFLDDAEVPPTIGEFCSEFSEFVISKPPISESPIAFFSPAKSMIGSREAQGFDAFMEARLQERSITFRDFLRRPENRSKTVGDVEEEFADQSPGILDSLNGIWDHVLKQASLKFDPDGKGTLLSKVTGKEIEFSQLSPGMQKFLLCLGHVFCLYFQKKDQGGFLFLDEPETGLHPELQLILINLYRSVLSQQGAQLFVSTHSPLIATQFAPESRVVLQFAEDGHILVSRGTAAEGTDPNDILQRDFGVKSLHPRKRSEQPAKVSQLKKAIRETDDQTELADLIDEVMSIRRF